MNDSMSFSGDALVTHLGQRLDITLAHLLQISRSRAQVLLKEQRIEVRPAASAKAEASYKLRSGDEITIAPRNGDDPAQATERTPQGEAIALDILYDDEALLALNKQAGLVVHPAAGHRTGTLVNALVHHLGDSLAARGGVQRLGLVHRLDKDTSGVMLIAKTDAAHEKLSQAFATRNVRKIYRALCWGSFRRPSGEMRESIGRHPVHRQKMAVTKLRGREAHTSYSVVAQGPLGAEAECVLHTGRTHQIRVHLAHLKHPVWGDHVYGRAHPLADGFEPPRQMLHAARLEIAHPTTGNLLIIEAPLPADFQESRSRLLGA